MLDSFIAPRYSGRVTETAVAGCGNPIGSRRTTAAARFFYVRMPSRAFFYGGPGGASFGWAGFLERRFSTPAVGPATPHVEMSDGPLTVLGARYA